VAGLESDRDGRAFAPVDVDGDGDLDLIVKNRNTPQLVLLRNDSPDRNQSIAFKLIGRRSNRDAVGASIRLITEEGERTKSVRLGSGFLTQSSRQVLFGLGSSTEIKAAVVTWPSGQQDRIERPPVDSVVVLREGQREFEASPFQARLDVVPVPADTVAAKSEPADADAGGTWLVDPISVPPLAGENLQGDPVDLAGWRGQFLWVNFWATWCAPCQVELQQWKAAYERIQQAGAEVVAVSVDEPGTEGLVRQFAAQKRLPFPVVLPDRSSVHAYKVFHRNLLRRPRDLQIPTTYLVNPQGEVVKVYRGATHPDSLLRDLQDMPASAEARWEAALPYPGQQLRSRPSRDYVALAFSFMNAGLTEISQRYLTRATNVLQEHVRRRPDNKMVHLYLGVALLSVGQPWAAQEALQKAIELDPEFADGYFNLGVAYSQLGQAQNALGAFAKTVDLDPGFADAYFNLAVIHRSLGRLEGARSALESMARLTPDSPEPFAELGVVHAERGALDDAITSFKRALELEPENTDVLRNLGVLYYQQGQLPLAAATLEQAHRLAPTQAETALSLAVTYAAVGRLAEARTVLESLLRVHPHEERARQLLQEIERISGPGRP
jgi:tetratricopeptide (TPR) repeat protein